MRGSLPSTHTRVPRWRRALRAAWLVAVTVAVVVVLRNRWGEVRPSLGELTAPALTASALAAIVGVAVSGRIWHTMLAALGYPLGSAAGARIFFVGQLGKYLPGSLWPALAQMELSRDHGVPGRAAAAAVVLFLWVHLLTGAGVAALALPAAGLAHPAWVLGAAGCAALLTPPVLSRGLGLVLRLTRRQPLPRLPDTGSVATAAAWALLMWICYGVHLFALVRPLTAEAGILGSLGAYGAAWCVGFLFVVAPAGAGVREGALVALLPLAAGSALAVALISRLLMTVADVCCGVVAGILPRAAKNRGGR